MMRGSRLPGGSSLVLPSGCYECVFGVVMCELYPPIVQSVCAMYNASNDQDDLHFMAKFNRYDISASTYGSTP
jgi:hypothetical protein